MTLEALAKLTDEQKRIHIAELCPDIISTFDDSGNRVANGKGLWWRYFDGEQWNDCNRNDSLNDLNAMHAADKYAAEHLMDADQWERYGHALENQHPTALLKSVTETSVDYYDFATLMTGLTARQRADAFLLTVG